MTKARTTTTTELTKAYVPADFESAIYERWLAADIFAPDGAGSRADPDLPPFVIIQPPPNITGALHLGHALTFALEDTMVRHARMRGHPTLWLPGLDHASIAAQYVLDKIIATEGETRESLGRERYLERMWRFIDETRAIMLGQERRLGVSADWGRLRFTMDEGSAKAVRVSFKRLHDAGLAYRTEALINWCPGCRTSVSDLEVIPTDETGTLWTVRYHLVDAETGQPDPAAWISVATTRPETILGDTAVAVHPEDERYAMLVGRLARIPFVERDVPIIADEVVDRAFGTGAVKITPAHDRDDYETGKRHDLPMITVLADDATVNEAGDGYAGLDRYEARKRIVADLEARGDLEGSRPHEMSIGRCQRSNDVIEPRLKTQWFVRTGPLAEQALRATRSGETRIVPARFEKVWESWLTNIHDWNVSRQLWWGHRIPAWYCPDGHVTVSAEETGPPACDTCRRPASELTQDPDIFDTWYSSGLWPFSTLGWPDMTDDLRRYYPGSVMETGYDIIFFWVARMMMLGIDLADDVPFRKVYLHGLVKDPYGQRMSKTKGNVVDPLEAIDTAGADALRFALLNGTSPGNDQKFSNERLEDGRNFANKLWNATRYVLGARPASVGDSMAGQREGLDPARLGVTGRWILSRAAAAVDAVDKAFADDNYGEVTRLLYDAIWSELCDWGIELAKVRLGDAAVDDGERNELWLALVQALDTYLRLLHPVMPFVTEALWQALPRAADDPDLLAVARWPSAARLGALRDAGLEGSVGQVLDLVGAVRTARAEAGLPPSAWLPLAVHASDDVRQTLEVLRPAIERLARVRPLVLTRDRAALDAAEAGALVVVSGGTEARLAVQDAPTGGGLDRAAERSRLEGELAQAEAALAATRARLADAAFVERAPAKIVEGARQREAELAERTSRLAATLESLPVTDHDHADDTPIEKVTHRIAAAGAAAGRAGAAAGAAAGRAGAAAGRLIASSTRELREGEAAQLRRARRRPLSNLFEVHPEARLAPRRMLGLKTIPVSEIVGTAVEGPTQRRGDFLPLPRLQGHNWQGRWQRLREAQAQLAILPPIDVLQTSDGYWVVDGHNRVAAALYGGQDEIDASVIHVHLAGEPSEPKVGSLAAELAGAAELRAAGEGRLSPGSTLRRPGASRRRGR